MSKADNLKDFLIDLANAIREKKKKTGAINPQDFSAEILSIVAGDVQMPNVSGTLVITEGITEEDYEALKLILGNNITIDAQGGIYIHFADPEVLRVLLAKITPNDGVGITTAQAEAVTSTGTWFKNNTVIETFDEFEKFTGLTTIKSEIFASSSIQGFTLPKSCHSITSAVCYNCRSLTRVGGLESLEIISSDQAFIRTSLPEIYLPKVQEIGGLNFREINTLIKVELGDKVRSIGREVFWGCNNLTDFIIRTVVPPNIGTYAFYGCTIVSIYVPYESVEAYKTATNWSNFSDRIKPLSEYEG